MCCVIINLRRVFFLSSSIININNNIYIFSTHRVYNIYANNILKDVDIVIVCILVVDFNRHVSTTECARVDIDKSENKSKEKNKEKKKEKKK